jgi:hypothetical protein
LGRWEAMRGHLVMRPATLLVDSWHAELMLYW